MEPARSVVVDASCLLALAKQEPGAQFVRARLAGGLISTVNWSEFLQKAGYFGLPAPRLARRYLGLGLRVVWFSRSHAERAAALWLQTSRFGISLADRACMALAIELDLPILTADRRWTELDLPVAVESIR